MEHGGQHGAVGLKQAEVHIEGLLLLLGGLILDLMQMSGISTHAQKLHIHFY